MEALLRAAMAAPSAGNQQPWQFVVIRERALLTAIHAKRYIVIPWMCLSPLLIQLIQASNNTNPFMFFFQIIRRYIGIIHFVQ